MGGRAEPGTGLGGRRLLTVAVLAAVVGGCGSSDEGASTARTSPASTAAGVAGVVAAANAFIETLDEDQRTKALLEFTEDNATAWSNLPCGDSCRVGVPLADLEEDQVTLAKDVLRATLGTGASTGYEQVTQILLADDYLGDAQGEGTGGSPGAGGPPSGGGTPPSGGMPEGSMPAGSGPGGGDGGAGGMGGEYSGYAGENYLLGFLGTPDTSGTWELVFGGHHLAVHITFTGGDVVGATPYFVGVEPTSFTTDDKEYAPLDTMRDAMAAMLAGLTDEQRDAAELSETYADVLVGPGEDGQFPETKAGLAVGDLTAEQQERVVAAMSPWVSIADDATAEDLMSTYRSQLAETTIAWSGGTELTGHANYVRIDGPGVWIEFVCQSGVVFSDQIHYHTIYRDHTRDYGGELSS
jgi:hypothetical protein